MDVTCFWIEPVEADGTVMSLYARRYAPGSTCLGPAGIHNAKRLQSVTELPDDLKVSGQPTDAQIDNWAWPVTCDHCDYRFESEDTWQRLQRPQYVRKDSGETFDLEDALEGAMWNAPWYSSTNWKGPDGLTLVLKLPNDAGDWIIDGVADNAPSGKVAPHWSRTGTPPKLTVKPSIGRKRPDGSQWQYHGVLTDGVLREA